MTVKVGIGMVIKVGIGVSPEPLITRGKATIAKMLVRPKVGIGMSQKVGIGGMSVLPKKLPSRLPKTTQRKDMGKMEKNEVTKASILSLL